MYHNLETLPKTVILDANVVMNSSFVPNGPTARAVSVLRALDFIPALDKATYEEAERTLHKIAMEIGWPYDPTVVLDAFIRDSKLWMLPASPPMAEVQGISPHDQHVAQAAIHHNSWILTGDKKLLAQCLTAGLQARLPWDVLMEHATAEGKDPPLELVLRCHPLLPDKGSIFARIVPGSWATLRHVGKFSVIDVEHVGWLYYCTARQAWTFKHESGVEVNVEANIEAEKVEALLVNYWWSEKLELYVESCDHPGIADLIGKPPILGRSGLITIGHDRNNANHLCGHIRSIVTSYRTVSRNSWKTIVKIPEAAPNPWDEDAVRRHMPQTIIQKAREER